MDTPYVLCPVILLFIRSVVIRARSLLPILTPAPGLTLQSHRGLPSDNSRCLLTRPPCKWAISLRMRRPFARQAFILTRSVFWLRARLV